MNLLLPGFPRIYAPPHTEMYGWILVLIVLISLFPIKGIIENTLCHLSGNSSNRAIGSLGTAVSFH
jgi:hypothetical protein